MIAPPFLLRTLVAVYAAGLLLTARPVRGDDLRRPAAIRVVDEATGRGIPLVELRTTNETIFVTDSAGYVAVDDPSLLGRRVFFFVSSHGYEFPRDGFGSAGRALELAPGSEQTLSMRRLNIAERLYRVTGAGIYVDSVKLGKPTPLQQPLLNGGVVGQDSVQTAVIGDTVHWFWGDTSRLEYPLGNFHTSSATSRLPSAGGLPPSEGVDLTYFVNGNGFSERTIRLDEPGVVWLDGVTVLPDVNSGRPSIVGHFSRREGLEKELAHGVVVGSGDGVLSAAYEFPLDAPLFLQGQAFPNRDGDKDYILFATPYPRIRVRAGLPFVCDESQYEGFTCLKPGSRFDAGNPPIERDAAGRAVWGWKRGTAAITAAEERQWIDAGLLKPDEAHWQTFDAATKKPVRLHAGSVRWNDYRKKWVMIAVQEGGETSYVGEVWYAEADRPEGPWGAAVRIVTHDHYSFYNPVHHDFFDEEGGRVIYFEGTYSKLFSREGPGTPRYDYNQIMYRLDLADPRLAAVRGSSSPTIP